MRVTIDDCRALYCVEGIFSWWKTQSYTITYRQFVRSGGMDVDEFVAGGDAHAQKVVDHKIAREGASHGR